MRHLPGQLAPQVVDAVALQGRDHEGVGEGAFSLSSCGKREQPRPLDRVDLVEDQDPCGGLTSAASRGWPRASSSMPLRASTQQRTTSASPAPPQADSTIARSSRRLRLEDAGRVDEMICAAPSMAMPRTSDARGLHLARDDRHLGADERIQQGRLAGIGRADQRDEARLGRWPASVSGAAIVVLRPHAFRRRRRSCRCLFGDAFRCAEPDSLSVPFTLTMITKPAHGRGRSARRCHRSAAAVPALRPFLQRALGIAHGASRRIELVGEGPADERRGRLIARHRGNRADDRLADIGEDRRIARARPTAPRPPPSLRCGPTSQAWATSAQLSRRTSSASRRDSSPSGAVGKRLDTASRRCQAQHPVAEELQPLIALPARRAARSHGSAPRQQLGVREGVAEPPDAARRGRRATGHGSADPLEHAVPADVPTAIPRTPERASSSIEKKMISARPTKFSNGT